jgi:hypothetical protein
MEGRETSLIFRKGKESVISVGRLLQISRSAGNETVVSLSSEYDRNEKEDLEIFKNEQTHVISS